MKKKIGRPVFFVVAALIIAFSLLSTLGISTRYGDNETTIIAGIVDIRWGIDIRGGVEATFSPADGVEATAEQLEAAKEKLKSKKTA